MKILIISPSWIGDTVMSHSLYRLLVMQYHSQIKIDVIAPIWCKSVIHRMIEVNQILTTPYTHGDLELMKCYNLSKILKNKLYQQAIILPNSLKSALIPFLANIPIRTGWRGEMRYGLLNDLRVLNKSSFPLMVHQYAALAYDYHIVQHYSDLPDPFPLPQLSINKKEIENVLYKFNLNKNKNFLIGLCPGSACGPIKNWPHYHYITLAIQLIYDGYHVIILGSSKDQLIKKYIERSVLKNFKKYCHNLIGYTSLDEAILILSACKGIVSNDSGLMHIACALKCPVVISLYGGNSNPNFTPPLFYNKSKVIYNVVTKDKYQKIKKEDDLYGYHSSLINITPSYVLNTLKMLLN